MAAKSGMRQVGGSWTIFCVHFYDGVVKKYLKESHISNDRLATGTVPALFEVLIERQTSVWE